MARKKRPAPDEILHPRRRKPLTEERIRRLIKQELDKLPRVPVPWAPTMPAPDPGRGIVPPIFAAYACSFPDGKKGVSVAFESKTGGK